MNDGTEKTVTDKHARRLLYYKDAELKEENEVTEPEEVTPLEESENLTPEVKEEKKTPANKKDKTKKETK